MTDIEKQALALVNEVSNYKWAYVADANRPTVIDALYRAIEMLNAEREAHAATKREVSDAVEAALRLIRGFEGTNAFRAKAILERFIIKPPVDPLAKALAALGWPNGESMASAIHGAMGKAGYTFSKINEASDAEPMCEAADHPDTALAARGGRIVFDGGE